MIPCFPSRSKIPSTLLPFKYRSSRVNIFQSFSVHLLTRVARKANAVMHSGLDFLARCGYFATVEWNSFRLSSLHRAAPALTSNSPLVAGSPVTPLDISMSSTNPS
jgi:hypothetical protein